MVLPLRSQVLRSLGLLAASILEWGPTELDDDAYSSVLSAIPLGLGVLGDEVGRLEEVAYPLFEDLHHLDGLHQ